MTRLTKAARRDLLAAHAAGGVALGLCYGPYCQLLDAGLAVEVNPPNAPNGYAILLTVEGHEQAERIHSEARS
jgi:hypothetical protein